MKTIHNLTQKPLRVSVGGGKILHLGPGQTGQIADEAVDSKGVQRLIASKEISLEGADGKTGEFAGADGAPREVSHGHTHATKVFPSGNRGG